MVVNPFESRPAPRSDEPDGDDDDAPPPVDPVPDCYRGGVWGTRLRHAALAVLIYARGEPLAVPEIMRRIRKQHVVRVGVTTKDLADALRHEVRRGRAIRAFHGHYVVGTITPRTHRRIRHHERQLRAGDRRVVGRWAQDVLGRGSGYRRPTGAR
jgi:hypothetical protein